MATATQHKVLEVLDLATAKAPGEAARNGAVKVSEELIEAIARPTEEDRPVRALELSGERKERVTFPAPEKCSAAVSNEACETSKYAVNSESYCGANGAPQPLTGYSTSSLALLT